GVKGKSNLFKVTTNMIEEMGFSRESRRFSIIYVGQYAYTSRAHSPSLLTVFILVFPIQSLLFVVEVDLRSLDKSFLDDISFHIQNITGRHQYSGMFPYRQGAYLSVNS